VNLKASGLYLIMSYCKSKRSRRAHQYRSSFDSKALNNSYEDAALTTTFSRGNEHPKIIYKHNKIQVKSLQKHNKIQVPSDYALID
jgi:hypothetical protein